MADINLTEKTSAALTLPLRVWVGGIVGFATIVGFFVAGWNDINVRRDAQFAEMQRANSAEFSAIMAKVGAVENTVAELDNRWQLRLLEFGEKLSSQIKDNATVVTLRERQDGVLKALDEIKARITLIEARVAKQEAEGP